MQKQDSTTERREIVGKGMIQCGTLRVGPVPVWHDPVTKSYDVEIQIVDVKLNKTKES